MFIQPVDDSFHTTEQVLLVGGPVWIDAYPLSRLPSCALHQAEVLDDLPFPALGRAVYFGTHRTVLAFEQRDRDRAGFFDAERVCVVVAFHPFGVSRKSAISLFVAPRNFGRGYARCITLSKPSRKIPCQTSGPVCIVGSVAVVQAGYARCITWRIGSITHGGT